MTAEELLLEIEAPVTYLALLHGEGFKTAIDIAMVDAEMAAERTGSQPDLTSALRTTAARARPSVNGWARAVSVIGGPGGDGDAGGTVTTDRTPASLAPVPHPVAGGSGNGVALASGALRAATRRVLKTDLKAPPPALSCFPRVWLEKQQINRSAFRTHMVLCKFFPTCRRLAGFSAGFGKNRADEDIPEDTRDIPEEDLPEEFPDGGRKAKKILESNWRWCRRRRSFSASLSLRILYA